MHTLDFYLWIACNGVCGVKIYVHPTKGSIAQCLSLIHDFFSVIVCFAEKTRASFVEKQLVL